MTDDARPNRQEISGAVDKVGWRLVLGAIYAEVAVDSLRRRPKWRHWRRRPPASGATAT